ncbi:MAG: nucleotide pyrophosphohydrolase [Candidatus Lokiarchaeota archaeon]|nr:nucleotide pyrophosphohydrolase [Candidatus Lokiarchaeota archaeon]
MSDEGTSLEDLQRIIRNFVQERGWESFHRPTALAISAAIEIGELLEIFQWRTDKEVAEIMRNPSFQESVSDEIADIIIYLLRLADTLEISLSQAIQQKMKKNETKYPAKKWAGRTPHHSPPFD